MTIRWRHGVLNKAALALGLAAALLAGPRTAAAGISGSPHDFADGVYDKTGDAFPKAGSCSACHIPHSAGGPRIWTRSLSAETSYFVNWTGSPNYIPGSTLLCYDCHDTNDTMKTDDDPQRGFSGVWLYSASGPYYHEPQDIALSGIASDSALWQTTVGYYELIDGTRPATGNLPTAGNPTGGHYWKSEPTGAQAKGDKIACELCHDPHNVVTGTAPNKNDAFFRTSTWDGTAPQAIDQYGQNLRKSKNARVPEGTDNRVNGRDMCANCHGYSDAGTQEIFFNVTAPKPPTIISVHARNTESTAVACTDCHKHNKIVASCAECHGFPPMLTESEGNGTFLASDPLRKWVENYSGGAGAHRRHFDALGTAVFDCAICHGPNVGSATWHNNGSGSVSAANVDIMGQTTWWGSGSTYYGVDGGETLPSGYAFEKKGGGDRICANLACHGNPPNVSSGDAGVLNWSDDMVDDATGAATADIELCTWCHDATPAALDKDGAGTTYGVVKAPNVMGNGTTWGAVVNGHGHNNGSYEGDAVGEATRTGRPAANKGCAVCHDATYTAGTHSNGTYAIGGPDKAHFDGSYSSAGKRINDAINGETLATLVPTNGDVRDAACIACHQRTTGSDDGLQVSSHGNTGNNYTRLEPEFQALCRACHEPHGRNWNGTSRNLHMIGKWLDSSTGGTWGTADAGEEARVDSDMATQTPAPAVSITAGDSAVVFTSRTGTNSFDENDGAYNPADDTDDVCATCHAAATGGGAGTGGGSHYGSSIYTSEERGNNCTASCHDHDADDSVLTYAWDAFLGIGAKSDMEQFFDAVFSLTNYNAVSGHPLDISAKTYAVPPDCIGCHQTSGGTGVSNECLKCHYEGYVSGAWVWSGHANGSLELRTAGSTAPPYTAACNPGTNCIRIPKHVSGSTNVDIGGGDDVYTHCLTCHEGTRTTGPYQLGNPAQDPPDIVPAGVTWTAGIGHGNGSTLSGERTGGNNAGPPNYDCGACHASTQPVAVGKTVPTYHASVNQKLVANTTSYAAPDYVTNAQKNSWCATRCHRTDGGAAGKDNNADNSVAKDNNVIDHFWAPGASETVDQTDCPLGAVDPNSGICETHPSYDTIVEGALFQFPAGLPHDDGTFICQTCHEPHGNSTVTPAGQMIRMNFSDGTLCNQCHK